MSKRTEVRAAIIGVGVLVVVAVVALVVYLVNSGSGHATGNWTHVDSPALTVQGAATEMQSVASHDGTTVAVGSARTREGSVGAVWTSDDAGKTWNRINDSGFGPAYLGIHFKSVTATPSGFTVLGVVRDTEDPNLFFPIAWTSPDGKEWDKAKVDWPVKQSTVEGAVADGGKLVGVGSTKDGATSWTSSDGGAHWQHQPQVKSTDPAPGFTRMQDVASNGHGFVSVGTEGWSPSQQVGAVWASPDGRTWSRADGRAFGDRNGFTSINAVTYGHGRYVAVGQTGVGDGKPSQATTWTSKDGRTWTLAPQQQAFGATGQQTAMSSVVSTSDGFLAGGNAPGAKGVGAAAWTSKDGMTWQRVQHSGLDQGADAAIDDVATTDNGAAVAVGLQDSSGAAWTTGG